MLLDEIGKELEIYNQWRRGSETIEQPNPTELGETIDKAIYHLRWRPINIPEFLPDDGDRCIILTNKDITYIGTWFVTNRDFTLDHDLEFLDDETPSYWRPL